ncbi:MAG: hypothetical protein WBL40_01635, partial [Terrimicrobiaceae bacterium]
MNEEAEENWRYWKAAISRLPTQEMREAAWEFFVRHFSQNPRMADTLSGLILVMQANGLYMLEAPRIIHEQAIDPLNGALTRLHEELDRAISRHKQIATQACETAEMTVTTVKGLDDTIRYGWREVDTEKLAERIHAELDGTLLQPLAIQCRHLEKAAPDLQDAVQRMEDSTRKLRAFHFKGILAVMLAACLVGMGGCFFFGWWKLSRYYDRMVDAALKRILSVNAGNQEAFTRLTVMNVPIRVLAVTDEKKRTIPRKFALVMDHAEDVAVEDTP